MSDQQQQQAQQQQTPAKENLPSPSQIAEMTEAAADLRNAGMGQETDVSRERYGQLSPPGTPGHTFGRR
jgi:hypothetical protein